MSVDLKSMFESIQGSLQNDRKKGGRKELLRLQPGNSYLVRLIPNVKDPKETFFHYFHHGWTSRKTGQYVDAICPTTWDDPCYICTQRFALYAKEDDYSRSLARMIRRMDKHFVNVYVIDDPTNEENNGTVKVLRFGVRIKEKFDAAIHGDDKDEFGMRVFDLSENGCNFKIRVESNSEGNVKFTNYNNSRFTSPSAISGMTPDKIREVYDSCHDLSSLINRTSDAQLKELYRVHLLNEDDGAEPDVDDIVEEATQAAKSSTDTELKQAAEEVLEETKSASEKKSDTDNKIEELLSGLDDLDDE